MTMMKTFAAALMASTLLAAPTLAQSNPPPARPAAPAAQPAPAPMAETPSTARTSQQSDQWRASKFVGLNVYNANNEKVGDINELIMSQDGQIDLVVIGAGGFLGMGEHNVALKWNQVKFVKEPVKSSSTTTIPTKPANTTGSGVTTTTNATTVRDYPNHAMVSMTKDQLKALPAFKYASDTTKSR
jgi:sporulation protein YlmC with PRC-barrel domain